MKLGYICLSGEGETDLLMQDVAAELMARGIRLSGAVQINSDRPGRSKSDMDLRLLPEGPMIRISLDRGQAATGCRLDTAALEEASVIVAQRLEGAQALLVNKFGKQEADGHGMADSVAEALSQGKPVLVGLADHFLEGFLNYAAGHAVRLPENAGEIVAWIREGISTGAAPDMAGAG